MILFSYFFFLPFSHHHHHHPPSHHPISRFNYFTTTTTTTTATTIIIKIITINVIIIIHLYCLLTIFNSLHLYNRKVPMQGPPFFCRKEKLRDEAIDFSFRSWFIYGRCIFPHKENVPFVTLCTRHVRPLDSSLAQLGMLAPLTLSSFLGSARVLLSVSATGTSHIKPLFFILIYNRASECARLWWNKSHCFLPGCAPLIARLLFHLRTQWRVYCFTTSCQLSLLSQTPR